MAAVLPDIYILYKIIYKYMKYIKHINKTTLIKVQFTTKATQTKKQYKKTPVLAKNNILSSIKLDFNLIFVFSALNLIKFLSLWYLNGKVKCSRLTFIFYIYTQWLNITNLIVLIDKLISDWFKNKIEYKNHQN